MFIRPKIQTFLHKELYEKIIHRHTTQTNKIPKHAAVLRNETSCFLCCLERPFKNSLLKCKSPKLFSNYRYLASLPKSVWPLHHKQSRLVLTVRKTQAGPLSSRGIYLRNIANMRCQVLQFNQRGQTENITVALASAHPSVVLIGFNGLIHPRRL